MHCKSGTHEYRIFSQAKQRCTNPNDKDYRNYGGRGIKFLFESYDQALAEVGKRPEGDFHFDRINNDGNYEPGNVKWSTILESQSNRRVQKTLQSFSDEELIAEARRRGLV